MALESFLALMTAAPRCCTVCETEEEWNNNRKILIRSLQSVVMCKLSVATMDLLKLNFILLNAIHMHPNKHTVIFLLTQQVCK